MSRSHVTLGRKPLGKVSRGGQGPYPDADQGNPSQPEDHRKPPRSTISYTPEEAAKFWSRVDRSGTSTDCWPWTMSKDPGGYGCAYVKSWRRMGKAHRIACELAHGPAPANKPFALHSCDNPGCCNPTHLRWGTPAENNGDMMARGRHRNSFRYYAKRGLRLVPTLPRALGGAS